LETRTVKTSTILISERGQTQLFRSRAELPEQLRSRLDASLSSATAATVLIADQKGRDEIMKLLRGEPSVLTSSSRIFSRRKARAGAGQPQPTQPESQSVWQPAMAGWLANRWVRAFVAFLLPAIGGALFYALLVSPR
jgi:hypothetical protein